MKRYACSFVCVAGTACWHNFHRLRLHRYMRLVRQITFNADESDAASGCGCYNFFFSHCGSRSLSMIHRIFKRIRRVKKKEYGSAYVWYMCDRPRSSKDNCKRLHLFRAVVFLSPPLLFSIFLGFLLFS